MRRAKLEQQRKRAEQQARQEDFRRRSFAEQQTALALQQFKDGSYIAIQTGTSKVENLIGTLIQEAPQDVQGLFTSEETLSDDQKALLRAAKEHIDRLLARSS